MDVSILKKKNFFDFLHLYQILNMSNPQSNKPPKNLHCYGCNKDKPIHSFSKTQVTKALSNIHNRKYK